MDNLHVGNKVKLWTVEGGAHLSGLGIHLALDFEV